MYTLGIPLGERDNEARLIPVLLRKEGTMMRVLSLFFGRNGHNEARLIPLPV